MAKDPSTTVEKLLGDLISEFYEIEPDRWGMGDQPYGCGGSKRSALDG